MNEMHFKLTVLMLQNLAIKVPRRMRLGCIQVNILYKSLRQHWLTYKAFDVTHLAVGLCNPATCHASLALCVQSHAASCHYTKVIAASARKIQPGHVLARDSSPIHHKCTHMLI